MTKEMLIKNKKRMESFKDKFFNIFRYNLSHFTDFMFTFDIIKFDRQLIKSMNTGISCDELVRRKYGIEGQRLIRELLELPLVKREKKIKKIKKIKRK